MKTLLTPLIAIGLLFGVTAVSAYDWAGDTNGNNTQTDAGEALPGSDTGEAVGTIEPEGKTRKHK